MKMTIKTTNRAIMLLLCLISLASCEEVIELDLPQTAERYVIEANLSDQIGSAEVRLSKTKAFSDSNDFQGEGGATVTIEDGNGIVHFLNENQEGVYKIATLRGTPGGRYRLRVNIAGETFTSIATMPQPVPMDSIYLREISTFNATQRMMFVRFRDPEIPGNYYRFLESRNGNYNRGVNVLADQTVNGNEINQMLMPLNFEDTNEYVSGDHVRIEFQNIDENMYKYWFSVRSGAQGSGQTAVPINPVTNITGGAIGYFSVHTSEVRMLTIM